MSFVNLRSLSVQQIFKETGVLISGGHFLLSSGRHASDFVNKDMIFADTAALHELARRIARMYLKSRCDAVLGPAVGGAILASFVSDQISNYGSSKVRSVFADKVGDSFVVKRGYDVLIRGKRVLIVEDVLTSGASVRKTVAAARAVGAEVIAVAALCNRGGVGAAELGDVPQLEVLMSLDLPSWTPEDCPMCESGVPIDQGLGHGAEMSSKPNEFGRLPRC